MATLPRAAVERKSGTLDFSDSYAAKMVDFRDSVLRQGSAELQAYEEIQKIEVYISLLMGNFWGADRPGYRSTYYDNYLADQRREALSGLSDLRPSMDISSKVPHYVDQAKIVNNYIRHVWSTDDLDLKLVSWIDHGLFGTGFWKMVAYEPGEFDISAHGLDTVIPVGMEGDIQSADAVAYRTYKSLKYFLAKFGREKCQGLEKYSVQMTTSLRAEKYSRPGDIPEYVWNPMSPAMKRRMSLRNGPSRIAESMNYSPFHTLDLTEIYTDDWSFNDESQDVLVRHPDLDVSEHNYHYIVPPGCRLFPRKRLIIYAGDRVMYDGPSPFWHGLYPFIMLQLNPCVWMPGGLSKYRDLVPINRSINRIGAGIEELINHALNPTTVAKRGSIDPVSWERYVPGKPNQKLLMNPSGDPTRDLRWRDPPQLPAYVEPFMRYLVDTIKRRSGSLDIMGLSRKKQAPSGDTVANMQDAMSAPFRLEARYTEAALKRAAVQAVSNTFQFATLDQRLRVLGPDGSTYEDFDYRRSSMVPMSSPVEDHWQKFAINVASGSMHGNSKQQKKSESFILRRQGDLSRKGLWDLAEVPYPFDQNEEELKREKAQGIGPATHGSPRTKRSQRQGGAL